MTAGDELVAILHEAARAAGAQLLDHYRHNSFTVDVKGASDLVTSADRAAEESILARIRAAYPEHSILAEESGLHAGNTSDAWYVDPLDGTLNFANHLPYWATSIAVQTKDAGFAGVVFDPLLDEFFAVREGGGVRLNGQPVEGRFLPAAQAIIYTHLGHDSQRHPIILTACGYLAPRIRRLRMTGSLALALAYTAAGRLDGAWQMGAAPWDYMAGALLVQENGGIVTDGAGAPLRPGSESIIAAMTPELHTVLLEAVAQGIGRA